MGCSLGTSGRQPTQTWGRRKDVFLLPPDQSKTRACLPRLCAEGETGLLLGPCNFKLSPMKIPTSALKAENRNSGQSDPYFPGFAAMFETNYFPIRGFHQASSSITS